jgi:uncharacterized protein
VPLGGVLTIGFLTVLAVFAGLAQGTTGFGFALLFTPLATVALQPRAAIASALVVSAVASLTALSRCWREIPVRRAAPLLAGGVVGSLAGARLLSVVDVHTARIVVAVVAAGSALLFWFARPKPLRDERPAFAVAGTVGGVLNASTSMGGPPAALALAAQRWPPLAVRGTMSGFNAVCFALAFAAMAPLGGLSGLSWAVVAWTAPAALIGTLVGVRIGSRMDQPRFDRLVLSTIMLAAAVAVFVAFRTR